MRGSGYSTVEEALKAQKENPDRCQAVGINGWPCRRRARYRLKGRALCIPHLRCELVPNPDRRKPPKLEDWK